MKALIAGSWVDTDATTTHGNTENGALRMASGVQIAWLQTRVTNVGLTAAYGPTYIGYYEWYYAAPFSSRPSVTCGAFHWGTSASWGSVYNDPGLGSATLRGHDFYSRAAGTEVTIGAIAIGRWKE